MDKWSKNKIYAGNPNKNLFDENNSRSFTGNNSNNNITKLDSENE